MKKIVFSKLSVCFCGTSSDCSFWKTIVYSVMSFYPRMFSSTLGEEKERERKEGREEAGDGGKEEGREEGRRRQ